MKPSRTWRRCGPPGSASPRSRFRQALADRVPAGVGEIVVDGVVHEARGRKSLVSVVLRRGTDAKRFDCDVLVLSLGLAPRDGLARMALPGEAVELVGDAAGPDATPATGRAGTVCLCEDVSVHDLRQAFDEGYRNVEILKRYTTATMGPCQGAMCGRALAYFSRERSGEGGLPDGGPRLSAQRTTATPSGAPGHARDPGRGSARALRQANVVARAARRRRRPPRSLRRLAPSARVPRLARRVPGRTRAREPDGRRNARQVRDSRVRCGAARRPHVPVPHPGPHARRHAVRAEPGRGRVRDGRRPAVRHRRRHRST